MVETDQDLVSNEVRNHIETLLTKMDIKNYTVDVSAGSVRGDNYLGVIAKVVVAGEDKNGKNAKFNFIVKSAPKNEAFRKLASIRLAFDREIYMYSVVFPTFTKFQEERGILKPFKCFAKYYESTMNNLNEALIMEDMKELGFELRDRREPLNYNHVMLVMREYGKLHALSYALRDQQPDVFKKLFDNTQDTFFDNSDMSENTKKSERENTERALKSLDPVKDMVAYNKFNNFQDTMFDVILEVVKSEPAGKYSVINHGDCWTNNILFKYKDSKNPGSPSELCLLDWQLSRVGSPALDLSYFIFTCTDKKLRDDHYDDIIQEYYNSLTSFMRELGSDPEKMLPFEVLQEHLKKFSVFGLYMSTFLLHLMTSEVDEIPDVHNAEHVDGVAENFVFNSKNEGKYHEKIRAVILDFVKFGYDF